LEHNSANHAESAFWRSDFMPITLDVNGERRTTPAAPDTPLLYVLRNDLELNGAKYGCGFGQCGACTVIVEGEAVRSCVTTLSSVTGKKIVTLEGLGTPAKPGPLQRAFIAEQAAQCGYCIAGMMLSAQALLDRKADPSEPEIRAALAGNLCRCGTHNRIVRAVKRAAKERGA
jgi:nicotinate dehydrogenase subunit A